MAKPSLKEREARRRHEVTIQLRAPSQMRDLIDRAAQTVGKSRSGFMLDCAWREAQNVLLDKSVVALDGRVLPHSWISWTIRQSPTRLEAASDEEVRVGKVAWMLDDYVLAGSMACSYRALSA